MSEQVFPTKLFIPKHRPSLIPRPNLIDYLNEGYNDKLTLVAAPAGFGKTTLVTTWLAQLTSTNSCWLSLDENDNLYPHFFTCFIVALQTVIPELAEGLLSSLQLAQPPDNNAILSALLHELMALDKPLLLVLDDYHVITNEAVHHTLTSLIDYMPPTVHLVIISREDPPLPLPRWRVRSQLNEIRVADLRFSATETAVFFQQTMGLQLDETAVATLKKRTEGWIAGLQLAGLSLRQTTDTHSFIADFSGSNRHVADYLLEEVLNRQPPEIQKIFAANLNLRPILCRDL